MLTNIASSDDLKNYLTISNSSLTMEDVDNYEPIAVFEVNFINILNANVVYYVPGINSEDTIVVKQYTDGQWNVVRSKADSDNKVLFELSQASTVAIYRKTS